jgi:hypothetical protein
MKKIIKLKEEEVVDGMVEDIDNTIKKTFIFAFIGISCIYAVLIYFAEIVIADRTHTIFAFIILTILYLFSSLSLKSYKMIQLGIIRKITTIKNTEEIKNGTTNNGKNNEDESNIEDDTTT